VTYQLTNLIDREKRGELVVFMNVLRIVYANDRKIRIFLKYLLTWALISLKCASASGGKQNSKPLGVSLYYLY